jgi:hypothetical protein
MGTQTSGWDILDFYRSTSLLELLEYVPTLDIYFTLSLLTWNAVVLEKK